MTAELVKLGVDDWARLEASQVRSLVTRMHKGLAPRSLATKVSALRSFCDWQVRQGGSANPARGIVTPSRAALPKNLDVDEMYQLLNITDEQDPLAVRDRAIMELMYSSGLRLAELVGLNLADVKLEERQLRVIGKGSRERVLPIGRMAVEWLHKWLKVRPLLAGDEGRHCSSPSAGSGSRPARYRSGSTAGATSRRSMPTCTPQAAPQLRHPHAGILRRPAGGAGAAGACGSLHHPDLYPPRLPASGQGI
jgi:site-specific recombinase XerC